MLLSIKFGVTVLYKGEVQNLFEVDQSVYNK